MGGQEEEKEGEKEVEEEQGLKGRPSSCPRPLAPLLQARLEAPVSKPGPHTCSQRECHIKERQDRMTASGLDSSSHTGSWLFLPQVS